MRLRRIARPFARKGLSVIAAFLLSEFPNFRWDLERSIMPLRSEPIVTDQWSWSNQKAPIPVVAATMMCSCTTIPKAASRSFAVAGTLHQGDHRWRGQHDVASHVLDHQLVVDDCDNLRLQ